MTSLSYFNFVLARLLLHSHEVMIYSSNLEFIFSSGCLYSQFYHRTPSTLTQSAKKRGKKGILMSLSVEILTFTSLPTISSWAAVSY